MSAILTTILALVEELLPSLVSGSAATTIAKVIALLEQIIPVVIQEAQALEQPVRNIIAALQGSGALTADQLAALAAQEATLDAAFDAAASSATAADAAASGSTTAS